MRSRSVALAVALAVLAVGAGACGEDVGREPDAAPGDAAITDGAVADGAGLDLGSVRDLGSVGDLGGGDLGPLDAGANDGGAGDLGAPDLGPPDLGPPDLGPPDLGPPDLGPPDLGPPDLGPPDLGPPDLGPPDLGPPDLGPPDLGPPTGGCISGAVGTHVARFRWNGTTSGSTAWLSYEANTLPDTSRWRAGAYSSNIGYRPVWGDPFLGEGGLDMGGTVFMDIELSTQGLANIRNVTIAIYGRSYSTGSSGSFSWQTFDGTGAAPTNLVSNVAPYRWYGANATAAFRPGNGGVLLRIRPGPSSNRLVVNRVEICFDAT